ncbi:hypothetical protein CKN86_03085 [Carnobacterium divergens]|uniref:Uncharacterized protein n=1 Tax=Carnobacterium divergens TaxID=2748 RepID=A0A5F0MGG6_CARDV|nr:hypothetical protein CKN62_03120 [Carnobacterium divergens]TFI74221.1 hypothetical protein CKN58_03085 [Carnobacterium divergens]TFI74559.1 hypothetical protein CKN81_03125 [Carnobacterium divergens]TFI78543.1 hypothetical protein CKN85_03080 [Carnobacterium divergens]TFI85102.1 hypothetical protein CKN56_03055 [Carnobacterium divergens]
MDGQIVELYAEFLLILFKRWLVVINKNRQFLVSLFGTKNCQHKQSFTNNLKKRVFPPPSAKLT